MVNEVKTKVPSSPLPYYVYADKEFSIPASTWQVQKTLTFSPSIYWHQFFIKANFQNYTQSAPCEVNIQPINNTTARVYICEPRGAGTNGILRISGLFPYAVTMTIS